MKSEKKAVMLSTRILAKLKCHTIESKIKSAVFENEFQLKGPEFRDIVHTLRQAGEPIGSDGEGYWYARSYAEIESTVEGLRSRGKNIIAAATHIAERFNGQQTTIFG